MTAGRMTYDLRRLRLHGVIERVPGTHRYRVTPLGLRVAMFFSRTYARLLRQGLALTFGPDAVPTPLRREFDRLDDAIGAFIGQSAPATWNLTQTCRLRRPELPRLGVADVDRWLARMRRAGAAPATIHNRFVALRAVLRRAVVWGWTTTNPAGLTRAPQVRQPPATTWDPTR